jgi:hypothetical protein
MGERVYDAYKVGIDHVGYIHDRMRYVAREVMPNPSLDMVYCTVLKAAMDRRDADAVKWFLSHYPTLNHQVPGFWEPVLRRWAFSSGYMQEIWLLRGLIKPILDRAILCNRSSWALYDWQRATLDHTRHPLKLFTFKEEPPLPDAT